MLEIKDRIETDKKVVEMEDLCHNLFNEWLFDLSLEEREVWLWNSLVEIAKIKQRRNSPS